MGSTWDLGARQKDSTNGFPQLFQLCSHITQGHIPRWIAHILKIVHLLTTTKPLGGICPIVMKGALYHFISWPLCFQFHDVFATHFPYTNLELQPRADVKLWFVVSCAFWTFTLIGGSSIRCGKCFQFGVKRSHISRTSCNKWIHHTTHPFCSCILCIWVSIVLACKQVYFLITFGYINIIPTTTIAPITYLGSWVFVASIIVVRFMVDQRPFLLEALAWVDNNIFLYQQRLKATCDLLLP